MFKKIIVRILVIIFLLIPIDNALFAADTEKQLTIVYFYSPTCESCHSTFSKHNFYYL